MASIAAAGAAGCLLVVSLCCRCFSHGLFVKLAIREATSERLDESWFAVPCSSGCVGLDWPRQALAAGLSLANLGAKATLSTRPTLFGSSNVSIDLQLRALVRKRAPSSLGRTKLLPSSMQRHAVDGADGRAAARKPTTTTPSRT